MLCDSSGKRCCAGISALAMSIDIWATKDLELRPLSEGNLVCDPAPCQGSCRRELGRWKGCKFLDMRLWHDASCIYHADVWNVGHERQILQCPSNTTWPWLSRDLTVITLCGLSCVTLPFLREISRRPGCLSICFTAVFFEAQGVRYWYSCGNKTKYTTYFQKEVPEDQTASKLEWLN